jgi:DNA polymerase-3 subunit gamma/tau
MLGLADRGRVLDLFDMIVRGDAASAMAELSGQYGDGADPMAVLRDLAEITHWVSVIKITPEAAEDPTVSPDERIRGQAMAEKLPMRVMTRMWQMLLKALEEVAAAPNAMMAAEMAIIRLTHVADLPTPGDLVKRLQDATPPPALSNAGGVAPHGNGGGNGGGVSSGAAGGQTNAQGSSPAMAQTPTHGGNTTQMVAGGGATSFAAPDVALQRYGHFENVLDLIRSHRDVKLLVEVETTLRLANYAPGRIEFQPTESAPRDLAQRLGQQLKLWTGSFWAVTLVNEGGAQTVAEVRDAAMLAVRTEAEAHPLVQAVITQFPGAKITGIKTLADLAAEAASTALPEVEDEWDPFEDS